MPFLAPDAVVPLSIKPLRISTKQNPPTRPSFSSDTSEASSKESHQRLLGSPPLSPSLPSPLSSTSKRPSSWSRRKLLYIIQASLLVLGLGSAYWFFSAVQQPERKPIRISYLPQGDVDHALVNDTKLPEKATAILVEKNGTSKWTVSIPPTLEFPLKPSAYADICSQTINLTSHVMKMTNPGVHGHGANFGYYHVDENFMDVKEAESLGFIGHGHADALDTEVCNKSITYMMETSDAGFGNSLLGMWMSYGLAQKEGRAFFVDDRNWAYGKYAQYFQPPPPQNCLPPPDHHRLPCPRHADHLLISSATTYFAFGHAFNEEFEDPKGMEIMRQVQIFAMLRAGYEALFHLLEGDSKAVDKRMQELETETRTKGGLMVGIHVRHGDKHPREYKYSKTYIPSETYVNAARDMLNTTFNSGKITLDPVGEMMSRLVLASDDSDVYKSTEFSHALHAQEGVIPLTADPVDGENSDPRWNGGFTGEDFWKLGAAERARVIRSLNSRGKHHIAPRDRQQGSATAMEMRALVGRSYLLDLAVVGKADRIVCGASTIACRLLAVMMGWDSAFLQKNWKNVDAYANWKGIQW